MVVGVVTKVTTKTIRVKFEVNETSRVSSAGTAAGGGTCRT